MNPKILAIIRDQRERMRRIIKEQEQQNNKFQQNENPQMIT